MYKKVLLLFKNVLSLCVKSKNEWNVFLMGRNEYALIRRTSFIGKNIN